MGSGKHRFSLAEILSHGYGERVEDSPVGSKSLEELERSLGSAQDTEMPLEELLALYGYEVSDPHSEHNGEPSELPASLPDMTLDKDQIAKDLLSGEEEEETQSSADDLTPSVTSHSSDIFRRHLRAHCLADEDKESCGSSDENTDGSSIPSNDGHKDIMVGPQYQAAIPPLSTYSYRERAYENEDQLLWAPGVLSGEAVEEFLLQAQRGGSEEVHMETPMSGHIIKDSEQALYELVKCRFNTEEALRRLRFNVKVFREELCAWSEEECRNFEHGYRVHGKNFHLIQANKVRTRSVGECVEYYYMWKKSDRHEYFTLQTTKLGRKKFSLQSGTMEDVEQDGEGVGMEGSSHCSSFPSEPVTMPHPEALDRDKRGVELEREVTELCGTPGQLSHFQPREDLQEPGADRTPPLAQLNIPPGTHGGTPPPELLGPGFYQLQLGPFLMDSRFSLSSASPPPTTAVAPAVSVPSEFGPVGSFLCPPVLRSPPAQHPHSLT